MVDLLNLPSPLEKFVLHDAATIWIKRDDLIHPIISGNKSRKLLPIISSKFKTSDTNASKMNKLLTFGGAYSNHIHATAFLGQQLNIETIGVIRGEELNDVRRHSPTLLDATRWGMTLRFISRKAYRDKATWLTQLKDNQIVVIPEGGATVSGANGCRDIVQELASQLPTEVIKKGITIIVACGTGTTLAGLIDGVSLFLPSARLIGVAVLKNASFLNHEIKRLSEHYLHVDWQLETRFHDGGYAKTSAKTQTVINAAMQNFTLPLEPIYTGKAFRALLTLMAERKIHGDVVFYHSGGLQGNRSKCLSLG